MALRRAEWCSPSLTWRLPLISPTSQGAPTSGGPRRAEAPPGLPVERSSRWTGYVQLPETDTEPDRYAAPAQS